MFISKRDRSVELTVTAQSLRSAWDKINQSSGKDFRSSRRRIGRGGIPPFSEEEFKREPKRSKFAVLLGRTAHMSYLRFSTIARVPSSRL